MEKPKFRAYTRPNGHTEFVEFMLSLPVKQRQKMQATMKVVEEKGMLVASQMLLVKKLDNNLYELRSRQGKQFQRGLYFHVVGNDYVITHGFSKKSNQTPQREIEHAIELREEFYQGLEEDKT